MPSMIGANCQQRRRLLGLGLPSSVGMIGGGSAPLVSFFWLLPSLPVGFWSFLFICVFGQMANKAVFRAFRGLSCRGLGLHFAPWQRPQAGRAGDISRSSSPLHFLLNVLRHSQQSPHFFFREKFRAALAKWGRKPYIKGFFRKKKEEKK